MSARFIMKYRAQIQRNTSVSDTGGGSTESWAGVGDLTPCFAWWVSSRTAVLSERPGVMQTCFVLLPLGTDVQTGDRLQAITDRRGKMLLPGPLIIDSVGERVDHLALVTRRIV